MQKDGYNDFNKKLKLSEDTILQVDLQEEKSLIEKLVNGKKWIDNSLSSFVWKWS